MDSALPTHHCSSRVASLGTLIPKQPFYPTSSTDGVEKPSIDYNLLLLAELPCLGLSLQMHALGLTKCGAKGWSI